MTVAYKCLVKFTCFLHYEQPCGPVFVLDCKISAAVANCSKASASEWFVHEPYCQVNPAVDVEPHMFNLDDDDSAHFVLKKYGTMAESILPQLSKELF